MNIQDGVYTAIPSVAAVYEKNDALKLEIHFTLCDDQGNAYTQTGTDGNEYPIEKRMYYALVSKDGAVNTKVIEYLRAWACGWDGADPFWFTEQNNLAAIGMVEVTLKTEPAWNDPQKTYQNIKFVNPVGHAATHGGGKSEVASGDKAAIMAKYGAKFKAAFGSRVKPAAPAAKKPAPAAAGAARPAASAARPSPASKAAPKPKAAGYADGTDGMNAVWDEFEAANPNAKRAELEERWFAAIDKHSDGKDQQNMTGEQWGKVAAELLGDNALAIDPDDVPF